MFLLDIFTNIINITFNVFLTILRNAKNIDLRNHIINLKSLKSFVNIKRVNSKRNFLEKRMKEIIKKDNGKTCHPYKPHIVSLKSRTLLNLINKVKNETSTKYKSVIEDKIDLIEMINKILIEVSKKLYLRCDPTVIYTFHNEINIVFFYKENGECIYDGNMNKILTSIVSYASIVFSKELEKNNLSQYINDFIFDGHLIEFDKDYETLNFLIWRQFVCKRNTISLLYKCLHDKKDNDIKGTFNEDVVRRQGTFNEDVVRRQGTSLQTNNMSIDDMKYRLPIISPELFMGNIIKKRNFTSLIENPFKNEENENKKIKKNRKCIGIEHFYFHVNFKNNFEQYIKKKIL
jgi:hypothetical protein